MMRVCRDAEATKDFVLGLERNRDKDKEQVKEQAKEQQKTSRPPKCWTQKGMETMTADQEFAHALEKAGLDLEGRAIFVGRRDTGHRQRFLLLHQGCGARKVIRNHDTGVKIDWTATGHMLSSEALQTQKDAAKTIEAERKVERKRTRAAKAPEKEREKSDKVIALPPSRQQGQSRGLSL